VSPHHSGRTLNTVMDEEPIELKKARFAVTDPLACQQFFVDSLGDEVLSQMEFETLDNGSTFRPVEVQLTSARKTAMRIDVLPGTRWIF